MPRLHILNQCLVLSLAGILTGGCAHLQMSGALPPGAAIADIGRCDVHAPFDLDAKGEKIAFADSGLNVQTVGSGRSHRVSTDSPCALAWSPDGRRIAAAFSRDDSAGSLRIYGAEGELQGEVAVHGRITGLAWRSATEILALDVRITQFSFGANLAETIVQWDGSGAPKELASIDSTLRPSTMRQWKEVFLRGLSFRLSPQRDEIIYAGVNDPPAFIPYLRIILHNLESGKGREIAKVSPGSGATFWGTGEAVLVGDGDSGSRLLDPWGDRVVRTIPTPGREIAVSPGGHYQMMDGVLYREGARTASFPGNCSASFSITGGRLAVECNDRLYLVSGLEEELPVQPGPQEKTRLRELRKWLSEGLITSQDYRRSGERAAQ